MNLQYLTAPEVATRYNVSVSLVYRWSREQSGPPALRIGGVVRFRVADLEAYEAAQIRPLA